MNQSPISPLHPPTPPSPYLPTPIPLLMTPMSVSIRACETPPTRTEDDVGLTLLKAP